VLRLATLLDQLPPHPSALELMGEFVPPARFSDKRFDNFEPRDPSQARARDRLTELAADLRARAAAGPLRRLHARWRGGRAGGGVYLDGGFGVGKTHLLAAFWHAAPFPKAYLTFDELVHFIGLVGVEEARSAFAGQRLAAVDEWELDDPGNLKLALAFLRGALADGLRIVVTSNTLPLELGKGRFSQKDFRSEIEELAGAFEVVRMEGTDFRHRRFEADPGREYFMGPATLRGEAEEVGERALLLPFVELIGGLTRIHPIRYAGLIDHLGALFVERVETIPALVDAIRWVHFVDALYDSAVPFRASSEISLNNLFPPAFLAGPYARKLSRCLSRMEEMLGE
jgi:cell division protein ZapE